MIPVLHKVTQTIVPQHQPWKVELLQLFFTKLEKNDQIKLTYLPLSASPFPHFPTPAWQTPLCSCNIHCFRHHIQVSSCAWLISLNIVCFFKYLFTRHMEKRRERESCTCRFTPQMAITAEAEPEARSQQLLLVSHLSTGVQEPEAIIHCIGSWIR